jgi:hypothetical protein
MEALSSLLRPWAGVIQSSQLGQRENKSVIVSLGSIHMILNRYYFVKPELSLPNCDYVLADYQPDNCMFL